MTPGELVRVARVLKGMSLRQLEEKTDIGYTYISEVERGIKPVSLVVAKIFCDVLSIPYSRMGTALRRDASSRIGKMWLEATKE